MDRIVNHKFKLVCPDFENGDQEAVHVSFWIDEQDVWNVDCAICGGQHNLDDMLEDAKEPANKLEQLEPMQNDIIQAVKELENKIRKLFHCPLI